MLLTLLLGQGTGGVHDLTAVGIATASPSVGSPAITQAHALTATDISTAAPNVNALTLTQTQVLLPIGIATVAPSVGSSALTQVQVLAAPVIATNSPSVDVPTLSEIHLLTAVDLITPSPSVEEAAMAGIHDLVVDDLNTAASSVGAPSLASEIKTPTKRGGDDAPALYDEVIERKRRKRRSDLDKKLDQTIRAAYKRLTGKGPPPAIVNAISEPTSEQELTQVACDMAARLAEEQSVNHRDFQKIEAGIAALRRLAAEAERTDEQAKAARDTEEESIVMMLLAA